MADLDTVQKIFRAADQDNGGTLDKNELKKLFLETSCIIIGREISEEDGAKWAAECIKQSSTNGATVTMAEFHHFMHTNANLFGPVFLWYDVFSHYATGGSGDTPLHLDELSALNMVKEIFKRRSVALSDRQALGHANDMMQLADKDGNKQVTFGEFVEFAQSSSLRAELFGAVCLSLCLCVGLCFRTVCVCVCVFVCVCVCGDGAACVYAPGSTSM